MPRKSKIETGHERVVPLSIPEVQLCVANSIERDTVYQEAVQRALQGYQLVLQGSLRDSTGFVTKEISGHAGYYRNVMRGVAHIFGVEKQGVDEDLVVRGAYLSDENDDSGSEKAYTEGTEPKRKRRALNRIVVERSSTQTERQDIAKPVSVFAGKQSTAVHSKPGSFKSAPEADENESTPVPEEIPKTLEEDPSPPKTQKRKPSSSDGESTHQTTPKKKAPSGHVPFNRYKGRASADSSVAAIVPHVRNLRQSPAPSAKTSLNAELKTDSNLNTALHDLRQSTNQSDTIEATQKYADGEVADIAIRTEKKGDMENLENEQKAKLVMNIASKSDEKLDSWPKNPFQTSESPAGGSEMISLEDRVLVTNESSVKLQGSPPESSELPSNDEIGEKSESVRLSPQCTPESKKRVQSSPHLRNTDLMNDCTPPVPNVNEFPDDASPEFFRSFVTNELKLGNDVKVFSEYDAVNLLEKNVLPGTWMMKNKKFGTYDFQNPEQTSIYCTIRKIERIKGDNGVTEDQWQLVLLKKLSELCKIAQDSDTDFETIIDSSEPFVFVLDSTSLGISSEVILFVRNIVNGILRKSIVNKSKLLKSSKKEMAWITNLVNRVTSNIVLVCMPTQPAPRYSGAYLLANLKYMFANNSATNVSNLEHEASKAIPETRSFRLCSGKSRIRVQVSLTSIDLSAEYAEGIFG